MPDYEKVGNEVRRFDAATGTYTFKRPGKPAQRLHADPFGVDPVAAGPATPLPTNEDAPICATAGHRIKVVWSHAPGGQATPNAKEAIRSIVRRMNWKLISESQRSSGNTRTLQMRVDCDAPGQIAVYEDTSIYNGPEDVRASVEGAFGAPSGADSVKYLVFRDGNDYAGVGFSYTGQSSDPKYSVKSSSDGSDGNYNRRFTTTAIVWHGNPCCPSPWWSHVPLHELSHVLGGSQYPTGDPAPFATPGSHCLDGLDVLCYDDGTLAGYSETRCWPNGYSDTPVGVPLDCGYDTYFDAGSQAGQWLHTHWNVGGAEDPFLVEAQAPSPAISGIDLASSAPGRLDLFGWGADNTLKYRWFSATTGWSAWETLGTSVTSDPAAVSWGPGRLDVFVRRTDNALWRKSYTVVTGWSAWESLGGVLTSGPGVASAEPGHLDVYVRGLESKLFHKYLTPGGWSSWDMLDGTLTADPAAISSASDRINVFARGSDNALWNKNYVTGSGWSGWSPLWGQLTSGPAVASSVPGHLDVYVRGVGDQLFQRWYLPTTGWSGWNLMDGTFTGDPAAVSPTEGQVDVMVRAHDGALWHKTYAGGTGWTGWTGWRMLP